MKTVIQVVQHLTPGGIEVMALELKKTIPPETRVLIVSLEGNAKRMIGAWPRLDPISNDIIFMDKKPGFDLKLLIRLTKLFRERDVIAVHTHHIGPLIYGGIAARLAGISHLVHTEHDAWHLENKKRRRLQRAVLALTRPKLIADSALVAKSMKSHLEKNDISVIRNGIDVELFYPGECKSARKTLGLRDDVIWVGCSGRLEPVKGHSTLIEAMALLPENVHLALAGNGSQMQTLHNLVRKLKISDRVHFLGHLDDMPTFYQSLDVFCLPSLQEGMPLAPLEAQACGIPAVVSDTGGTREAICEKTGQLVVPGDSKNLAKGLARILFKDIHASPRKFVESSANLEHMVQAYAKHYHVSAKASVC